jgi:hypothetical protein
MEDSKRLAKSDPSIRAPERPLVDLDATFDVRHPTRILLPRP